MSRTPDFTIVVGKIPTSLVATTPPPSSAVPGEGISFIVQLTDTWGTPLAGKTVTMHVNGESASIATASDGKAMFGVTFLASGTFTMYAEFAGDTAYEGCLRGDS